MIHSVGVACTCRVEDVYAGITDDGKQRRRDPFCDKCGQDGWIYRNPRPTVGIITGVRHQKNILDAGEFQPGDATFSPSPNSADCDEEYLRIGAFDKLTATWPEPVDDGQVLIRAAGSKAQDVGIKTYLKDNEDRLWYEPARAIWCEDEFGIVYKEGADFELGPGRLIKWVSDNRPNPGTRFSLKYEAYFEWIVWQPPGERRDRNEKNLGEIVQLRKRHVQFVNSSPFATEEDRESLQAQVSC